MSKQLRILIVDDDRRMVRTLQDIFAANGYLGEGAYSGVEALAKVKLSQFDCVLTDIKMPEMDGVQLYRAISGIRPELPVVLVTAYSSDKLVKEGLEAGALASLSKPLNIKLILRFFSSLNRRRALVIVDDDPEFCKTTGGVVETRGYRVRHCSEVGSLFEHLQPDEEIVLLDMKLENTTGLEVLRQIREHYPRLPVILTTGYREEMEAKVESALELNAYACLYKPFPMDELLQLLNEIRRRELGTILSRPLSGGK